MGIAVQILGCDAKSAAETIKLYISAFEKVIAARRQAGKTEHAALWNTGEEVMRWWMGCDPKHDPDQLAMLLEEAG